MRRIILCLFACLSLTTCTVGIVRPEVLTPNSSVLPTPPPTPYSAPPTVAPTPVPTPYSAPPTIIPSGALWRVVTVEDGDLHLYKEEGASNLLTFGGHDYAPVFSPDGSVVLFRRGLNPDQYEVSAFELYAINADGSDERRVLGPEELDNGGPSPRVPDYITWLPDNRTIAFETSCTGCMQVPERDLWLSDTETGNVTQLLGSGQGGSYAFSPDGSVVLFGTSKEVVAMDADGSNRRTLLTFERVNIDADDSYYPTPVWAPDGSYALVAIPLPERGANIPITRQTGFELWKLLSDGYAVFLSTTLDSADAYVTPQWSPDRTLIAYNTVSTGSSWHRPVIGGGKSVLASYNRRHLGGGPEAYEGNLIIANADGSSPVIYETQAMFLGWLPAGQRFLFLDSKRTGTEINRYLGEVRVGQLGFASMPLLPPDAAAVRHVQWIDEERFVCVTLSGRLTSPHGFDIQVRHLHRNDAHSTLFTSLDPYAPQGFSTYPKGK